MIRKYLKFTLLFGFVLAFVTYLPAQSDISGLWEGEITQYEGGYRSTYGVRLKLKVEGNQIIGESHVFVEDIFAIMKVEGEVYNKKFIQIKDTEFKDNKIRENMSWCFKEYQLMLKKSGNEIEGFWQGNSAYGPCIPGRIFLKRKVPQA